MMLEFGPLDIWIRCSDLNPEPPSVGPSQHNRWISAKTMAKIIILYETFGGIIPGFILTLLQYSWSLNSQRSKSLPIWVPVCFQCASSVAKLPKESLTGSCPIQHPNDEKSFDTFLVAQEWKIKPQPEKKNGMNNCMLLDSSLGKRTVLFLQNTTLINFLGLWLLLESSVAVFFYVFFFKSRDHLLQ